MLRVVSLISSLLILLIGAMSIVLDAALAIDNVLGTKVPVTSPVHVSNGALIGIPFGAWLFFAFSQAASSLRGTR